MSPCLGFEKDIPLELELEEDNLMEKTWALESERLGFESQISHRLPAPSFLTSLKKYILTSYDVF